MENCFNLYIINITGGPLIPAYPPNGLQPVATCCLNNEVAGDIISCGEETCARKLNNITIYCLVARKTDSYCSCASGFYRNDCGECVTEAGCKLNCLLPQVPKCTLPNEVLVGHLDPRDYRVCPSSCTPKSSTSSMFAQYKRFQSLMSTTQGFMLGVQNVCNCADGYYRNSCGKCVRIEECSKKCTRSRRSKCPGPFERSSGKNCVCINGYKRNACYQCVPVNDLNGDGSCLCTNPCPGLNLIRRCFVPLNERTCANYLNGNFNRCTSSPTRCTFGCDCSEGYYRNSTGSCVLPSKCYDDTSLILN